MAPNPIIFAMSNPDPEITYEDAKEARPHGSAKGKGRRDRHRDGKDKGQKKPQGTPGESK